MNLFFSEEAQQLIVNAKKEMYDLKHPYVGSEHLLLAILHSDLAEIVSLLASYGITYHSFRDELIRLVGIGKKNNDWFLFTPLLKKIINRAIYQVKDSSESVTPNHLFISLLQEGEGVANRILIGMNIDFTSLYDKAITSSLSKTVSILEDIATNMNEECLKGKYDPVFGRDLEVQKLMQTLLRKNKNNPLLIGDAGVGKTAIVEEFVRRIVEGKVPLKLRGKIVYNLSVSSLVAGTKYRGEFEEKVNSIIQDVQNHPEIILFLDEIHTIIGAGGAEGAIDASNILKPYLARGDVHIIGATTYFEYTQSFQNDKAFDRRFQKIVVDEPILEEVMKIIFGIKSHYEKYHGVIWNNDMIRYLLELSNQFPSLGRQPDRSIDFLDDISSYVSLSHNSKDSLLSKYELKIQDFKDKKNQNIMMGDFKKASSFRKKELSLQNAYNQQLVFATQPVEITREDIEEVICRKVGFMGYEEYVNRIDQYIRFLNKNYYGDSSLVSFLRTQLKAYSFWNRKHPFVLSLVGKSGVGKSFLSLNASKIIFSHCCVISLSMDDYRSPNSLYRITGPFDSHLHSVLEKIRVNPFTILILDHFDRACGEVSSFFQKSFSDGFFTLYNSDRIDISKCIVFLLCNQTSSIGFSESRCHDSFHSILLPDVTYEHFRKVVLSSYPFTHSYSSKKWRDLYLELNVKEKGLSNVDSYFSYKNPMDIIKT